MKRIGQIILILFVLAPLTSWAQQITDFSGATRMLPVVKAIDGDTIELASGDRVRLLHINTPERGEDGSEQATEMTRSWTVDKKVEVRFGKVAQDRYGRYLAEIFVDGKSLNEELVRQGWAHAFFIPPIDKAAYKRIVAAQVEARTEKRGIWNSDPRYRGAFHITSFHHDAPGDDRKNLNGEYVRIVNISTGTRDLRGFRLENERGRGVKFPRIKLPVGRTISVRSGSGKSQTRARRGQQVYFMKLKMPLWRNKGDVAILRKPDGAEEDRVKSKVSFFRGGGKKK
ncbi:MAG: hypothetical protein CMH54_04865 [Myxococcales bacterium]|nr:hypothetical protein [Myxococcales bacterium]|tara:strand:- start:2384 stop:3238 length:855 start_codon:yes stop_codon:yes gene_type:complete